MPKLKPAPINGLIIIGFNRGFLIPLDMMVVSSCIGFISKLPGFLVAGVVPSVGFQKMTNGDQRGIVPADLVKFDKMHIA